MPKITLKWLKGKCACREAIDAYIEHTPGTDPIAVIDAAMKTNRFDWAVWLMRNIFNKRQSVEFAIYCAEFAPPIYEKRFSKNKAPREAIEAAKCYLKKPCKKTKCDAADAYAAAADAAADAYAAVADADADAYAADAAAAYAYATAAYGAAYAAAADAGAAYAYAAAIYAATDAYAYAAKIKIIEYGKQLIKRRL